MSLELLKQDMESRSFRRMYYLYGSEPYLKRYYLNSLISSVLPKTEDLDLHRYEGKGMDPALFAEELWLCSCGGWKVMLIYDLPVTSPLAEFLCEPDCEIPEDTVVIIYQQTEQPDLRTKGFKSLKARVQSCGLMVEINTVDDATLLRWVAQQFRRHGCSIQAEDVAYFCSVEERNMESMLTEIEKISAYCNGPVSREALERLCVKTVQARAYELGDLILAKQSDRVFSVLNDLRSLRTPPQMILGSLFSCFASLYKLKQLQGVPERIQKELFGSQAFLVRKYSGTVLKLSENQLEHLMNLCAEIDVLSKTGVDPDLLVVRLLTEALDVL